MEDVLTVYKIDANFVYGLFFKKKKLQLFKGKCPFRSQPCFVAEAGCAEGVPAVL